jgi:UPF0176 protein
MLERTILNIAAYKFVAIDDPTALQQKLLDTARSKRLLGTILLAPEGINFMLAGESESLETFLVNLAGDARFADLPIKRSKSSTQPFRRLLVKVKREIVGLKRPDIRPDITPAPRIAPAELKRWLDEGRPIVLLDTRNEFEVKAGTFVGAQSLGINAFSDLPAAAAHANPAWHNATVVTFCTGGIRCEKAAPLLASMGFREVLQLDGGILRYFEECGNAHYTGDCFVFDERVALDDELKPRKPSGAQ